MLRSPGDPATPDRGDQATSARHADRAAARATAIAAGLAAAVYVERGTIANGLAAWHPSRAHNKIIGVPPTTVWREPPHAPSYIVELTGPVKTACVAKESSMIVS